MSIPDLATSPAITPQVITTDAVSEHVLQWPSDSERDVFIHSDRWMRIIVAVAAAGLDSGIRVLYRFATNAALTGTPLVLADSGILLPAVLTAGAMIHVPIQARKLPEGYDFSGAWFDVVSEAGSGGFALRVDLVDAPESVPAINATP